MKAGTLVAVAGGLGLIYFYNLGTASQTVQVVLSGVQIKGLSDWQLTLMIQNVSNATIVVNSLSGVVNANGKQIATISAFPPGGLQVPANSQQPLIINFSPSVFTLPGAIIDIINSATGNNTIEFNAVGNMNLNSLVLPFNLTQNVSY